MTIIIFLKLILSVTLKQSNLINERQQSWHQDSVVRSFIKINDVLAANPSLKS